MGGNQALGVSSGTANLSPVGDPEDQLTRLSKRLRWVKRSGSECNVFRANDLKGREIASGILLDG